MVMGGCGMANNEQICRCHGEIQNISLCGIKHPRVADLYRWLQVTKTSE